MLVSGAGPSPAIVDNVGYIVVDDLPSELLGDLADAGVSEDDLRALAGRDGVIRGADELDNLFRHIDEPSRALQTTTGRSLFDALQAQIDRNRQRAIEAGGRRFENDAAIMAVLDGGPSLGPGSSPTSVFRIEQALADIGFLAADAVDGDFDDLTANAIERFQHEADLNITSRIDAPTLGALLSVVPPPGERLVLMPEYDRMYAGDRLEVTLAIAANDRGFTRAKAEMETIEGLLSRGFERVRPDDFGRLETLGIDGVDPHIDVWASDTATVRLVMPTADDPTSQSAATRAVEQSQAVLWTGRTFTLGADKPRRAGLLSRPIDRPSMVGPDYQLICASGCDAAATPAQDQLLARSRVDTDIIFTNAGAPEQSRGAHALHFLDTILQRGSAEDLKSAMGGSTATERGFLYNRSNRTEAA